MRASRENYVRGDNHFAQECAAPALCELCGIPLDSQYFDESGLDAAPEVGQSVVLARFQLPAQYCGVLQYFSQFTDLNARDPSQIQTPGLEWRLLSNGHGLSPYMQLNRIINPWGFGSFPVSIRLDEHTMIELIVRRVMEPKSAAPAPVPAIRQVGGRIVGRYWYNAAYGAANNRYSRA